MSEEVKESQVQSQLHRLECAIEALRESVEKAEEGLSPILRDEGVSKDTETPKQELVVLAATIEGHAEQVERLAQRVDSIASRIEI